jgi:hypothetical protein
MVTGIVAAVVLGSHTHDPLAVVLFVLHDRTGLPFASGMLGQLPCPASFGTQVGSVPSQSAHEGA